MRISDWSSDVCSSDLGACAVLLNAESAAPCTAGEETTRDRLVVGKDAWRNDDRTVNAQCVADANCDGRIRCRRVAKTAELDVATYRAEEGRIGSILAIADDFSVQPATGVVLVRSEEHTSELQSLLRISYAVFCLKKKKHHKI